jgi:hypothetical protein
MKGKERMREEAHTNGIEIMDHTMVLFLFSTQIVGSSATVLPYGALILPCVN